MDKKKLLQIIKKDAHELADMAEELLNSESLSIHEIEFALSKSRIVLQELEFLKELVVSEPITSEEEPEPIIEKSDVSDEEEPESSEEEEIQLEEKSIIDTLDDIEEEVADVENGDELIVSEKVLEKTTEKMPPKSDVFEYTKKESEEADTREQKTEAPKIEKSQKKSIGDTIIKQKSLNEILSDTHKLDQKLASSPIQKLESAIGLNDRFQYIRELFKNDAGLFQQTVKEIDGMDNFEDAIGYLDQNYKWEKNDTSIKFAQLVKRRFTH